MTRQDMAGRIEAFVRAQFAVAPTDTAFTQTAPLFELGYIDSVGVVELLAFLAQEFGVEITDAELLSGDFQTLSGIAGIVHGLRSQAERTAWGPRLSRKVPTT
ncbi:MAG: acyl carrier protein [Gemmatimonadales bacterium]